MARGAWDKTARIVSTIAECNRDSSTNPTPFRPSDFNPFRIADEELTTDDGRMKYDPSVMQVISERQ